MADQLGVSHLERAGRSYEELLTLEFPMADPTNRKLGSKEFREFSMSQRKWRPYY
jgi:hypothetical protein